MQIIEKSNKRYWHPAGGKMVTKCNQTDPGAVPYVAQKGRNVGITQYRLQVDGLVGKITGMAYKKAENGFGPEFIIDIDDKDVISVGESSRYYERLASVIDQIDPNEDVKFVPFSLAKKEDPAKFISGWTIYQNGRKLVPVPELDPKDPACQIPKGEPLMTSTGKPVVGQDGRPTLDWSAKSDFLFGLIDAWMKANLDGKPKAAAPDEDGVAIEDDDVNY